MKACPTCGSQDLRSHEIREAPPRKQKDQTTVKIPGWLCWRCRMFHAAPGK